MRRLYILCYGGTVTRETLKELLNTSPYVITWRHDMPHSFYLVSTNTAQEIAADIRSRRANEFRFLVIEIDPNNKQGWLPEDTWYLLNNKKLKG